MMIYMVLFVPVVLLGLLLGMERVERWTDRRDEGEREGGDAPAGAAGAQGF